MEDMTVTWCNGDGQMTDEVKLLDFARFRYGLRYIDNPRHALSFSSCHWSHPTYSSIWTPEAVDTHCYDAPPGQFGQLEYMDCGPLNLNPSVLLEGLRSSLVEILP